nr:hypothetical protein [Salmonella enterica subsp. diarizonae]
MIHLICYAFKNGPQQYSTAVQLDSAVIKMFKDLLSGITSKI